MADLKGFLGRWSARSAVRRRVDERVHDWHEVYPEAGALLPILGPTPAARMDAASPAALRAARSASIIPEWNDLVWRGDWDARWTAARDEQTPKFTDAGARACGPPPCSASTRTRSTIANVEVAIIDKAWDPGYVRPQPPEWLSGRTVAVIGSGRQAWRPPSS